MCITIFRYFWGYDPSWADFDLLLRELFPPDKQDKIVEKKVELTLQAGGSQTDSPQVDPGWDCNNQTGRHNCQTVVGDLINVIRACKEIRLN